jgi:RNA polymerase sigma-70 factor (ECF subfamily)
MLANTKKMSSNMTDAELVQGILTGNMAAFEQLMRRYNQALYRAARSILKDQQEAEEAVQDAYLKAFHAMADYRSDAKLSTWLTRIVVNEALARRRKRQRRAELFRLNAGTSAAEHAEDVQMQYSTDNSPEEQVQRSDVRRIIERNIDKLPEVFRCVFVLRAVEEMSVEETATCLGIPEATVRSRFFRARALMREAISQEVDLSFEDVFSIAGIRCDRIVNDVLAQLAAEVSTPPQH